MIFISCPKTHILCYICFHILFQSYNSNFPPYENNRSIEQLPSNSVTKFSVTDSKLITYSLGDI